MRISRPLAVATTAVILGTFGAAAPADAATQTKGHHLTKGQKAQVRQWMVRHGKSKKQATYVANHYKLARRVPLRVRTTVRVTSHHRGKAAAIPTALPYAKIDCPVDRTASATATHATLFNTRLYSVTLRLHWCYDGMKVSGPWTSRTHHIYFLGGVGQAKWKGWDGPATPHYASYKGHSRGQAVAETTGIIGQCFGWIGCLNEKDAWARLRGYYDGRWHQEVRT